MKIIDTHCHLDLEVFDADREQVLQESPCLRWHGARF